VSIDPTVAGSLRGGAPLFIIARNPAGGPPLAVIRRTADELPLEIALRNENAMMQGMTILDQPELELVARVSLSGSPAAQPGDLFGEITYQRGSGPVQIRIDRIVE
jgi:cytochrome c-type biogenesis protein CcmH